MSRPWIANMPEEAAVAFEAPQSHRDTVCISITEPERREPSNFSPYPAHRQFLAVLRLQFHDFDALRHAGHPTAVFFDADQAREIVAFATAFRGKNMVVHCAAGISRSGAVVEALLQAFPEYEDRGWGRHANGHVKALLKRALGLVPAGAESNPIEVGA